MTTRAEWFRYEAERSGPKRPARKTKARPEAKPHNLSGKDRKALYAFEDFAPGTRPSRKSSRKASNRQKTDAKFRLTRARKESAPRRPATPRRAGTRR